MKTLTKEQINKIRNELKEVNHFDSHKNEELFKCLDTPKAVDNFEDKKVVEGYVYELVEVKENKLKSCKYRHNSNIGIYKRTGERTPIDYTKSLVRELTLQGVL